MILYIYVVFCAGYFVMAALGLERTSEVDWSASTRFEENWTGELLC